MKLRLIAMLFAIPALVAGLLVIAPAEAAPPATHYTFVTSTSVAMHNTTASVTSGGVRMYCKSSSQCRGTLQWQGASDTLRRSYSIRPRTWATIPVYMSRAGDFNPETKGTGPVGVGYKFIDNVELRVNEATPKNLAEYTQPVRLETPVKTGRIDYAIHGNTNGLSDVKLQLVRTIKGGNTSVIATREIPDGNETGSFSAALASNNEPGEAFKLRLSARDAKGEAYSWYWRGSDGNPAGGGRYLSEGSPVRATKDVFNADVYFGTINGTAPQNSTVRVAGIPATYSGATLRRSLDIPSCANVFAEVKMGSATTYSVPFLPFDSNGTDKRYIVSATKSGRQVWMGSSSHRFGSCMDALNYNWNDHSNFLAIPGAGVATRSITDNDISTIGKSVTIKTSMKGFSPTVSDRNVRLREKIPGLTVLESPLVAESATGGGATSSVTFDNIPPGKYIIEVGRRTSCATWYPSRYPNNAAYLNGADRGAESWKAFSALGTQPLSVRQKAVAHGATRTQYKKPAGYAGWMYRDHCKAYGQGIYRNELNLSDDSPATQTVGTNSNTKGAVVKGRVTRIGGKTNKEMMVRLSSSDGKRVIRTDVTDGSGYFYIAGLPSGNWTISVNPDSWRGIGRTFTGKHSVRVTAGHGYSVGTLKFRS